MIKIIEQLSKCISKEEFLNELSKFYYSQIDKKYIPTLIKLGDTFTDDSLGDLYIKLILAPKDLEINDTWMQNNLAKTMIINANEKMIYNLITQRNFKHNILYDINPILYPEQKIIEIEQTNNKYTDLMIDSYVDQKEVQALQLIEKDNFELLLMHSEVLEPYINIGEDYDTSDMKLYMEFEYRIKEKMKLSEYNGKIDDSFLDILIREDGSKVSKIKTWIRGTILLNLDDNLEYETNKDDSLGINVSSLGNGIRDLNPYNYNDDMDAGLVVFDNEALDILIDKFYFFDMMIISKKENGNSMLIDLFEEYFVFWEGEFNKLEHDIKEALAPYNIIKENEIISDAMFAWQLETSWDFIDKARPFIKLANRTKEENFELAIDYGLSFYYPRTSLEFKKKMEGLNEIYLISPENFDSSNIEVQTLQNIYNSKSEINISQKELFVLTEKYSFAVLRVIDNE